MSKVQKLSNAKTDQYLTVEEASKQLGIKPTALRNYLYQGKFTTYKFKMLTLLSKREVTGWKTRKR